MKKRITIIIVAIAVLIAALIAVLIWIGKDAVNGYIDIPEEQSDTVRLDKTTLLLRVGDSERLQVLGSQEKIDFISADEKTATVAADGSVTAVSVGQTEISCKIGEQTLVCSVFVSRKGAPTESFVAPDTDDFSAVVGSSGGYVGEYAAVTLYLWKKAELSGFSLTLSYDSDALTLCKADFMGAGIDGGEVYDDQNGNLTVAALSHKTNGIVTSDKGAVPCVLLVFQINEGANAGDILLEPMLSEGDMFVLVKDGGEVLLDPKLYGGKIKIKK